MLMGGYFIFIAIYFVGFALLLFLLDWLTKKSKKQYWPLQILISSMYILFLAFSVFNWLKYTLIVFPTNFKGDGGIVYGIESYPELPKMKFGKRTIEIPPSGILITSSKFEDLPNSFRLQYQDGSKISFLDSTVTTSLASKYPCILTKSELKHFSFNIGHSSTTQLQELLSTLCDSINQGDLVSTYQSKFSMIHTDVKKPYLWVQNRGISKLPNNIKTIPVEEIILSGNKFTEIPEQVLNMPQLEKLVMSQNPISKLPDNLESLKNLKSLYFNSTFIKEFPIDLSDLVNLEHIGLAHSEIIYVPEPILTIPNLKRIGLDNNKLTNLKFMDSRLEKLESIYLYSNDLKQIDCEIKHLKSIKELLIFDNEIDSIPDCIGSLLSLEKLEIWSNPISYISPEIKMLKNLKSMRLDKDNLTEKQIEETRALLPHCEIIFQ